MTAGQSTVTGDVEATTTPRQPFSYMQVAQGFAGIGQVL